MWFDKKQAPSNSNIDLPNFCFEFTPAESRKGGIMIYKKKERFKHL